MTSTCLVACPDALVGATIGPALARRCDLEIVGQVRDAQEVRASLEQLRPDLLLLSADLPGAEELCSAVDAEHPGTRLLVLGADGSDFGLLEAMENGAEGYISPRQSLDEAAEGVRQVLAAHAYVPPGMLAPLLRNLIERNREEDRVINLFMSLTRREREIVELMVEGCDPAAVAELLYISPQTARTHIQNIISKFGVHSRLEVVALVTAHGLIDRLHQRSA